MLHLRVNLRTILRSQGEVREFSASIVAYVVHGQFQLTLAFHQSVFDFDVPHSNHYIRPTGPYREHLLHIQPLHRKHLCGIPLYRSACIAVEVVNLIRPASLSTTSLVQRDHIRETLESQKKRAAEGRKQRQQCRYQDDLSNDIALCSSNAARDRIKASTQYSQPWSTITTTMLPSQMSNSATAYQP